MPLPIPEPGLVVRYAYLWHSEYERGREEGDKNRPCAIILTAINEDGDTVVTVLPVTHTSPRLENDAVELPLAVKQRLGLDDARSWVVVNEMNRFVWPGPDLRPIPPTEAGRFDYGLLPPGLFRAIRERFLAAAQAQRSRIVPRTEQRVARPRHLGNSSTLRFFARPSSVAFEATGACNPTPLATIRLVGIP